MRNQAVVLVLGLLVVALNGCQTAQPLDEVTINVSNKVPGPVEISFVPQFDFPASPGSENVRSMRLDPGQTKQVKLARGIWEVLSVPDDDIANPDGDKSAKFEFYADGNVSIEDLIMRYEKTGKMRKPRRAVENKNDRPRLRRGGIQ